MREVFQKIFSNGLTPNSFYILICIKEKIVPDKSVNKELECSRLKADNWLTQTLQLTDKSIIFITEIDGYFKKSKKKTSKSLMGPDFMDRIKDYVEVFPNKKLPSGKYARVPAKNLENAFRWFFENFDYDWQTIYKATDRYVTEYEGRQYAYMRNSQYFLRKQNLDKSFESELANYCEYIQSNPDDEIDYFKELIV